MDMVLLGFLGTHLFELIAISTILVANELVLLKLNNKTKFFRVRSSMLKSCWKILTTFSTESQTKITAESLCVDAAGKGKDINF